MIQDTSYTSPEWLFAIYIPPISIARLPFLHGRSCISGLDKAGLDMPSGRQAEASGWRILGGIRDTALLVVAKGEGGWGRIGVGVWG